MVFETGAVYETGVVFERAGRVPGAEQAGRLFYGRYSAARSTGLSGSPLAASRFLPAFELIGNGGVALWDNRDDGQQLVVVIAFPDR